MSKLSPSEPNPEKIGQASNLNAQVQTHQVDVNKPALFFCGKFVEDYEYRRAEGSVTSLNYHFVFCPKRRKAVLINQVAARLQEIIFELVTEHGWKLIALEIMPDHVHCFLNVPPHESPSDIARWIKGRASHHLRQEFPELKKMPCLWSPSYFVASTGQVSTEVVKRYIEDQRSK